MSADLGEVIVRSVQLTDATGVAVDADSLPTWSVVLPDGTAGISPTVTHGATGEYYVNYPTVQAGLNADIWTATVSTLPVKVGPDTFHVRPASPAPLLGMAECRTVLGLGLDTSRDEMVREYLEAATELIEDHVGQSYRRRTIVETHDGGRVALLLRRGPVQSITSVTENGASIPSTAWVLDTSADLLYRGTILAPFPWITGTQNVVVTFVTGAASVSARVRQACRVTLQHIWATQGGASGSPNRSTAMSLDEYAPGGTGWSLPRAAEELLAKDRGMTPGFG